MPRAYQWTTLSLWCTITAGPWLSTSWRLRRWRTAPRPPCTTSTPARCHPCTRWSPLSCPFLRRSLTSSTCWAQTQVSSCPCLPSAYCVPCTSLRRSLTLYMLGPDTDESPSHPHFPHYSVPSGHSTCWAQTQVSPPHFPLHTVPCPPCMSLRMSLTSTTCWAQTQVSSPPPPPPSSTPHLLCDTWWWPGHFHFQVAVKCRFLQFWKLGGGGRGGMICHIQSLGKLVFCLSRWVGTGGGGGGWGGCLRLFPSHPLPYLLVLLVCMGTCTHTHTLKNACLHLDLHAHIHRRTPADTCTGTHRRTCAAQPCMHARIHTHCVFDLESFSITVFMLTDQVRVLSLWVPPLR